jgi:hypothetical protein
MNPLKKYLLTNIARLPEGETGAGTETSAPTTGAPAAGTETGSEASTGVEAFKFDPSTFFVPPANEGSGEGEGGASGKSPAGTEPEDKGPAAGVASTSPGPTPSTTTPEPAKTEGDDPLAALRASVQAFLTKPATPSGEASPQPSPAAPTTTTPTPAKDEKPRYDFNVPDEVVEALGAEEPSLRKKAVNGLMTGLANKLAQDFGSAMAVMAEHVQKTTVEAVLAQINQQKTIEDVRKDFYDAHPDLKVLRDNLPPFDGMVWAVAQQVAQSTGKKGYDAEVRDQTAAILKLQLNLVKPGEATPKAPAAPGGRQPRPGQFSAGGSGGRPNGSAEPNEFASVLIQT